MKKRILFTVHLPPPVHGASMAGKYIHDSVVINDVYDTTYINLTTAGSLADAGKAGLKKIFVFTRILWKVFATLLNKKFDLCYVSLNSAGASFYKDFLVVLILKIFRKKIIYHFHNRGVAAACKKRVNSLLYKLTFKHTNSILLSPAVYVDIKKYVKEDNIFYCPNGIPVVPQSHYIKNSSAGHCRFLFLSNMMEEKGVYVLLDACKILNEKFGVVFTCDLIGGWADISEEQFNEKVLKNNLTGFVQAYGAKYNQDKYFFLEQADVFVFPTHYRSEVFPLVILEAMQFKLPIISTNTAAICDQVVDGKTGYLVSQKNSLQLAERMKILIDKPLLREKMGRDGYNRYINKFTLQHYENNLVKIFTTVINGNRDD